MKKFISFSCGVESSTLCVIFSETSDAIFADTGYEHKLIYDRINEVEKWCKEYRRSDFTIHRIRNEKYISLRTYILNGKFYPSFQSRFCTRLFKIEPIDDFLEQYKNDGVELMIGLNVNEIEQRTGNHGNKSFVKYSYPLADLKLNREQCKGILKNIGLLPNFPAYMQRGGCMGCYYKSKKEYEAMAILNPDEFNEVQHIEDAIQDRREDYFSILPNIKMQQIRDNVKNLIFKPEEIYPVINDATVCGVFCNR